MQSRPNFKKDLTIVVEAPDGNFVSFCGMWYDGVNRLAYVEPVATDPDYRRMGLGKAAVLEGIRRCGTLGATVAYVGSDQEFYQALGFINYFIAIVGRKSWLGEGAVPKVILLRRISSIEAMLQLIIFKDKAIQYIDACFVGAAIYCMAY